MSGATTPSVLPPGRWRGEALAVGACLALALLLTWPLALHLHDRIIGHPLCTNRIHVWVLWAVKQQLWSGQWPGHSELIFYPYGADLVRLYGSDLLYPLLLAPLTHLLSPATVFNLKIIFSLTVASYGAYRLLRHLGAAPLPAWCGGALYVGTPYFLLETLNGVSELVAVEWVPFALLYLLRTQQPAGRPRDVALAVLFATLASYASGYNALFLLLFGALLVAWRLLRGQGPRRRRLRWRPLLAVALLAGLALAPYALLHRAGGTTTSLSVELADMLDPAHRPMADSSASLASFFRPGRNQIPLLRVAEGGRQEKINTTHTSYLGYGVLALALVGLLRGRRPGLWAAAAATFAVIALGPHLVLSGDPLVVGGTRVPLPALLLYKLLPGFDVTIRHTYRYVAMVHLALAVLSGLGLCWLVRRVGGGPRGAALALGAAALCLLEVLALGPAPYPIPQTSRHVPAPYAAMAADPARFAIIELPHEDDLDYLAPYLYYQTVHGKPMIDGAMHSRLTPRELSLINAVPLARAWIQQEDMLAPLPAAQQARSLALLRQANYRHVLVHDAHFKTPAAARAANARMVRLLGPPTQHGDGVRVYDLRAR